MGKYKNVRKDRRVPQLFIRTAHPDPDHLTARVNRRTGSQCICYITKMTLYICTIHGHKPCVILNLLLPQLSTIKQTSLRGLSHQHCIHCFYRLYVIGHRQSNVERYYSTEHRFCTYPCGKHTKICSWIILCDQTSQIFPKCRYSDEVRHSAFQKAVEYRR